MKSEIDFTFHHCFTSHLIWFEFGKQPCNYFIWVYFGSFESLLASFGDGCIFPAISRVTSPWGCWGCCGPSFWKPCLFPSITVVCLSILAGIQEHSLHALLWGCSHQRPGTLFALAKNTCSSVSTQSPLPHPWCHTRDGDAMLLPPVLTWLGMPQNQGGTADSMYGIWAAGLFWIAGRFMANTRSTFSGLWLSESVVLLSVCKPQSVERQVKCNILKVAVMILATITICNTQKFPVMHQLT